jgi:heme-degrading monooxygenase HmoA
MFIAMNRFQVVPGSEEAFEQMWLDRDVYLRTVPGFETFRLLKGPVHEDHVLYSSHTAWSSRADFENWTRSEQFRDAHRNAGNPNRRAMYLGGPQFEGFEVLQTIEA